MVTSKSRKSQRRRRPGKHRRNREDTAGAMEDLRRAWEQHHQAWTNEMIDLKTILARDNLNKAYQAVVRNKGSSGVDGMEG